MDKAVERKKKWSQEEEKIVTNTVLEFLQEGKTQKEAFEEAALSIGRTPGACSFRWNNKLKKEISIEEENPLPFIQSLTDCITFLQTLNSEGDLVSENSKLKETQQELKETLQAAENNYDELKAKYKELLNQIDENELQSAQQIKT
ncbi:hypothetical protein ACOJQI_17020 [Bacillus salacetis]|uniref:hypothetical protein n=1 Tax=Bacillus salacetis TaxID=2315464 RepID=UPI003B9F6544